MHKILLDAFELFQTKTGNLISLLSQFIVWVILLYVIHLNVFHYLSELILPSASSAARWNQVSILQHRIHSDTMC